MVTAVKQIVGGCAAAVESKSCPGVFGLGAAAQTGATMHPAWSVKTILVPTDFSSGSVAILDRAESLARYHGATLTLLHVVDINPRHALAHCGTATALMRQLWFSGATGLAELRTLLRAREVSVETLLLEGLPGETIVETSAQFDLLVINEPVRKSPWSLFSKCTARTAIEQSQCPVLVLHQTERVGIRALRERKSANSTNNREKQAKPYPSIQ